MIVRSLSFKENEKDLANYFDNNGKSDIAKTAMRFYIKNKDKIMISSLGELFTVTFSPPQQQKTISNAVNKLLR